MGLRTEEVHRQIGKQLAQANIEKVILIKNSVTSYIEQGLKKEGYKGEVVWFGDALAAFAALPHLTVKGDVVLLQNDWPDQYQ
jgi:UDP-N-acetylmuramyl pentapeptide synthase